MSKALLLLGDARTRLAELPDESVHCIITSPPYWGLRDYGVDGQMGREETFQEFLDNQVALFRECKRILRKDGILWVNMGDSYNSPASRGSFGDQSMHGMTAHGNTRPVVKTMHSKNKLGQPWRLALALQDDGWILRQDNIWHKKSPMPEAVTDRTTNAHEYVFHFSKSPTYFYDAEAIKEKAAASTKPGNAANLKTQDATQGVRANPSFFANFDTIVDFRNKRSVWSIASEPFPEAHFATFPTELVKPCILAGTSEKGCCLECGAPVLRVLKEKETVQDGGKRKRADAPGSVLSETSAMRTGEYKTYKTVGWQLPCEHGRGRDVADVDLKPCVVLDPFNGSGTTGLVALRHQRDYIGIELNPEYLNIAYKRIRDDAPLFNQVEIRTDGPKATSSIQQGAKATTARAGTSAKRTGTAGKKRAETASEGNAGRGGTKSG